MSRFCKEKPDVGYTETKKWIYGVDYPPPSEDYTRVREWKVPRVYDRVEGYKETDFKDFDSDLSDVGDDEPTVFGNPMWTKICDEHRSETRRVLNVYDEVRRREEKRLCGVAPETEYISKNLFPLLGPALEATLTKASELGMLKRERCGFDPVDMISELLWNMNPRCPSRAKCYRSFFDILPFKKWLRTHPRPDFPRNYFWNKVESAICIQRNYRGYLIRRMEKVQQLRTFWRVLKGQKPPPDGDPELNFGADITAYKEHNADLAKWNEEQQAKRKEEERIRWLKEEGQWADEIPEEEADLAKQESHRLSTEMYGKQVERLVGLAVETAEAKEKPPVEIFNFGLSTHVNVGD